MTGRRIHNVMDQTYRRAVLYGYIEKNPCEGVQIKRKEVKQLKYPEPELILSFLKHAYKRGNMDGLFFKILFESGLGKGETAALQWSDINLKKIRSR